MMRLRIKDDRDRRVPLHWRGALFVDSSTTPSVRTWPLAVMRRAASRPAALALVAGAVVVGAGYAAASVGPIVIALAVFSPIATVWITLTAMSVVSTGDWFAGEARRIKSSVIAAGRCPSCDYSIVGVEPGADGLTVCPECAAAWDVAARREEATPARIVIRGFETARRADE